MIAYFVKTDPRAVLPVYKTVGSVACDICVLEDTELVHGRTTKVRTGLVAVAPIGCYWELYPRSSLGLKKEGVLLSNSVGIIDQDFCGPDDEICVLLYNASKHDYEIKAGERIAQLVLKEDLKKPEIEEKTVDFLKPKSRGGFGSTDSK
jgi:dUTP pyrophosphatase